MMTDSSRRPERLPLPTVWSRFKGQRAMDDGRVPGFWVQCVCPRDDTAVLDIMQRHFLPEEEVSRILGSVQYPELIAEARGFWQNLLEQRLSLSAWTMWPDGDPRLVAVNVLYVRTSDDPEIQLTSQIGQKAMRCVNTLEKKVDIFARHDVKEYLSGVGLSVLPEFRGQGLGREILRARVPLCRALGLRVTATIFTGIASQKQSERAGFQTVAKVRYQEFVEQGDVEFAKASCDAMELKVLVVPPKD